MRVIGQIRGRFAAPAVVLLVMWLASPSAAAAPDVWPSVIPLPRAMRLTGDAYHIPSPVTISATGSGARSIALVLASFLRARGIGASVGPAQATARIRLRIDPGDGVLGPEGYRLDIGRAGIAMRAERAAGLFYALQTFEQIAEGRVDTLPGVAVVDRPEYRWRGIHLDVSRHFFPVAVIERYIDLAARYKLNVFHWHLTDDQGWRLPIAAFPRLTAVGGCRDGSQVGGEDSTAVDRVRYCGAYTEADVRAVVAYARERFVTVVPEIEMPGHSVEVLAAYPQFGCARRAYRVRERWGISTDILCPRESTFRFVDAVLGATAALFPGPIVHVGGDEVPADAWEASSDVAALRARLHPSSIAAVRAYFARRVEDIARAHGRRIAGWDEITPSVSTHAIVVAWHGADAGAAAARRGNDVVMTPDPPLYFDAYQGDPQSEPLAIGGLTTLQMVYDYDPMPPGLTRAQRDRILGAQGNLWTEYIPTPHQLWYMLLPRELALAEVCWTPRARKRWSDFERRAGVELARLDARGQGFRIPNVTFTFVRGTVALPEQQTTPNRTDAVLPRGSATVELHALPAGAAIRYTLDGSVPTRVSPRYAAPLRLAPPPGAVLMLRAIAVLAGGRASAPSVLRVENGVP